MRSLSFDEQQESPSTTLSNRSIAGPSSFEQSPGPQRHPTPFSTPAASHNASEIQLEADGHLFCSQLSPAIPQSPLPASINSKDPVPLAIIQRCRYCTKTFSSTSTLRQASFPLVPENRFAELTFYLGVMKTESISTPAKRVVPMLRSAPAGTGRGTITLGVTSHRARLEMPRGITGVVVAS